MTAARAILAALLLAAPAAAQAPGWPRPAEGCVGCHALFPLPNVHRPIAQSASDVHGRAGVGCAACHGGNPVVASPLEAAHDESMGFVPAKRLRAEVVDRCGRCHAGPKAEYLRGAHAGGEGKKVPDCASCHYADHLTTADVAGIATRARCGECHGAAVAVAFREPFDRSAPALAKAHGLASDSLAWREAAARSGLEPAAFEAAADVFVAARVRFRDVSHRADHGELEVAAGELEALAAGLEPGPIELPPERATEPLYIYFVAGALVMGAIAYFTAARRSER